MKLTRKQQEIWDAIHDPVVRVVVACMSRQIGKTVIAEVLLVEALCRKSVNAYISPTYSQGKKVYRELVSILQGAGLIEKANASDLTIETIYGGFLKFFSMESPSSIRGYTVDGLLVLDEAAFFPEVLPDGSDPWANVIFPITKARKPKVLMISTPNGKRGFFYRMVMRSETAKLTYRFIKATIYDDQMVSKADIEEMRRELPDLAFRQEFLVEFLDDQLTVFPGFSDRFLGGIQCEGRKWIGIDVSSVGADRTVVTIVDEKGNVESHVKEGGSLDEKYRYIADLINKTRPVMAYIEDNSIGAVMANEVRKQLVDKTVLRNFTTTNESKRAYVGLIAVGIANGQLSFRFTDKLLRGELETFTYALTPSGKMTYKARGGFHDDTVTSLGIALQCREDNRFAGQRTMEFVRTNSNAPAINDKTRNWYTV